MKPKDYNKMMSLLLNKPKKETEEQKINKDPNMLRRLKYNMELYDNVKVGKDFDKAIELEDKALRAALPKTKRIEVKKKSTPLRIDFGGIHSDVNVYKNIHGEEPEPVKPREEKLEGLETILGVPHPFKKS